MQVVRPHRGHGMRGAVIGDLASDVAELVGDELQRAGDVDQRHGLEPAVVAQERQHRFQHRAHLVEIAEHAAAMGFVLDEFGAQAHPRDRRAQIVADRGEHLGAVVDQPGDALAHAVERARDRADFLRAAFGQRRGGAVEAEALGGLCEGRQRRGQCARRPQAEQGDADDGKQQRHHPGAAEKRRPRPVRQDIGRNHHAIRQADADLAVITAASELEDAIVMAEAPLQAVRVESVWLGCRQAPAPRGGFRCRAAERRVRCRPIAAAVAARALRRATARPLRAGRGRGRTTDPAGRAGAAGNSR